MKKISILLPWLLFLKFSLSSDPELEEEELRARDFMAILNKEMAIEANIKNEIEWNYEVNMNDDTLKKKIEMNANEPQKLKELKKELQNFNWRSFSDPDLKRQFLLHSIRSMKFLSEEDMNRFESITTEMKNTYSTATICEFKNKTNCELSLVPDLVDIFTRSRDEDELKHVWIRWSEAVGPHVRSIYKDYVDLLNKAANLNNFKSADHMWLFPYEEGIVKDIRSQFERLLEQVKPLYQQLHAYIRFNLKKVYGDVVNEKGPIPAHLLGDIWSQSWVNIGEDFKPFPKAIHQNLTEMLQKQNYTVEKLFQTAEQFFTSIGLSPMTETFWKKSIFTKIPGQEMMCQPAAWDFLNGEDFRIKMCGTTSAEDFYTIHHEMALLEYFMQYKDQPFIFKTGANPGFHKSIGDLIKLSTKSPKHLSLLGLFNIAASKEETLNNLYEEALDKIIFLPYSYIVDRWRWDVFSGKIPSEAYNCEWWELMEEILGVEAPVPRTEVDFDPASIYHIVSNDPHIRYFVATVLQFQLHRALCERSGEYDPDDSKKPLHMCDIYQKSNAGSILKDMLKMGSSRPWPEVLHIVTGQRYMDASAISEYFRPLQSWLEKENRKNDVHIGWEKASRTCSKE